MQTFQTKYRIGLNAIIKYEDQLVMAKIVRIRVDYDSRYNKQNTLYEVKFCFDEDKNYTG